MNFPWISHGFSHWNSGIFAQITSDQGGGSQSGKASGNGSPALGQWEDWTNNFCYEKQWSSKLDWISKAGFLVSFGQIKQCHLSLSDVENWWNFNRTKAVYRKIIPIWSTCNSNHFNSSAETYGNSQPLLSIYLCKLTHTNSKKKPTPAEMEIAVRQAACLVWAAARFHWALGGLGCDEACQVFTSSWRYDYNTLWYVYNIYIIWNK